MEEKKVHRYFIRTVVKHYPDAIRSSFYFPDKQGKYSCPDVTLIPIRIPPRITYEFVQEYVEFMGISPAKAKSAMIAHYQAMKPNGVFEEGFCPEEHAFNLFVEALRGENRMGFQAV